MRVTTIAPRSSLLCEEFPTIWSGGGVAQIDLVAALQEVIATTTGLKLAEGVWPIRELAIKIPYPASGRNCRWTSQLNLAAS